MSLPEVSVIVVTRNESKYMLTCLESICQQFSPGDNWELLLVDGKSDDKTIALSTDFLKAKGVTYSVLSNDRLILATGWNIGIKNAKGRFLIRPDAHASLGINYIKGALNILKQKPEVAAVGGVLNTCAVSFTGSVIREALSMKTGVGNSSFRTGATSGYKDTVVYGLYRKDVFEKAGFFNENLVRHQDTEFHYRMEKSGMRFYMESGLVANYFCRDSVKGLLSQMYNIGYYFSYLIEEGALSSLGWRHRIPFLFYLVLIVLLMGSFIFPNLLILFSVVFTIYLTAILVEAISKLFKRKKWSTLLVVGIIPLMHCAYAWGTFRGSIRLLFKNNHK